MNTDIDEPMLSEAIGNATASEVKSVASGRRKDLLQATDMNLERSNECGHRCPKCSGEGQFNVDSGVDLNGIAGCQRCFSESSGVKPDDGIVTVAGLRDIYSDEATQCVADQLESMGAADRESQALKPMDIIADTARDMRVPVEAFRLFGVREAHRGRPENRMPVARVDLYNDAGQAHAYFDVWPGDEGRVKRGQGHSGLFFPGRLPKPGETWLAAQCVKSAATLVGLGYNAFGIYGNHLASTFGHLLQDVDVVLVPDVDLTSIARAKQAADRLSGVASSVAIARLPGEVKQKNGDDVSDCLNGPEGERLVRDAISRAPSWEGGHFDVLLEDRSEVVVRMNEADVSREVVEHLGKLGWESPALNDGARVFVRGGVLVHVVESEEIETEGRTMVRDLPSCLVRERISQAVRLVEKVESKGGVEIREVRPPSWLVESIYRRGAYGGAVKPLVGVIESPTIRGDGSIVQEPGYDLTTGLIFSPKVDFPAVPTTPSQADAEQAIAALREVLVDFPLAEDADASAWIAMVLSMIGRSSVNGHVPLFAVTANVRGSGKSLLVDAATLIAYGHRAARKAFTRNDEEMRKAITAVALAATPSVLFDNLDVQLGGSALDAAITSATWSDRLLGQSRMTGDLPMRTIWSATGNNMAFGSDVGRRVLPIRLQSPLETPEDRSGFRHHDLLSWVEAERPRLAVAALTILRAYFVAGCPVQPGGDWGSFERWSAIIRGSIVWAGGADPLLTRTTALAGDDTAALLGKLIVGIETADPSGLGLTTKEIEQKTFGSHSDAPDHEALAEAVFEICGERFNGRKFGRRVRGFVGRVWQGRYIEADSARGGVARWRVRHADGGFGGFGGSIPARAEPDTKCAWVKPEPSDAAKSDSQEEPDSKRPLSDPPNQPNPPGSLFRHCSNETDRSGSVVEI